MRNFLRKPLGKTLAGIAVLATAGAIVIPQVTGGGGTVTCGVATANVADGSDPWGGCFPGPNNTGVPSGATLTTYTGSCNITVDNTTIDLKTINCPSGTGACRNPALYCLNILADNVTITNSYVNGSVWVDVPDEGTFTITDSTVDPGPVNQSENNAPTAIGKSDFIATRVETVDGGRGIWCEYDCKVIDSYIHGQDADEGGATHESGIRQGSGTPGSGINGGVQTFTHNTVVCEAPDVPPDAGCSADVTGYGDFAPIQYNTWSRNLLLSTTGGTCAYGGNSRGGRPYPDGSNNSWTENVFQRGEPDRGTTDGLGHCGYWYGMADWDGGLVGNVFTGNVWDDGSTVLPNT